MLPYVSNSQKYICNTSMVDFSITTESLHTRGYPPIEDSTWYGLGAVPPAWQKGFDG